MYERRSLVRWMAMRRTLFVFPREDIPTVQAAVSTPLAAMLRRRLISRLQRNGSEPHIEGDIGRWLADLEDRVEQCARAARYRHRRAARRRRAGPENAHPRAEHHPTDRRTSPRPCSP